MKIHSKAGLALLALALSCSPLLAQGGSDDPPPNQQGARDGFGQRGQKGQMGPGGERGQWGGKRDGRGRGGRRGRRKFGLSRLLRDPAIRQQAGISHEQAAKIRQMESGFRKTQIRGRADLMVKRIDLEDLLAADKPDRAAIDSKLQEISAAQLAMAKSRIDYRLNMRDAITPAQREKLRQLMRDRWQSRRGPARPGPQGAGRRGQRGPGPTPNSQGQPRDGAPPPTNN
jgi:Spy/CpxP family protein refolding chaperone